MCYAGIIHPRRRENNKVVYVWTNSVLQWAYGACKVHLQSFRNYVCNDVIRKVLRDYFGYHVRYCMNVTDIDDKIIDNSKAQKVEYFEFAKKWEHQFFENMRNLKVQNPDYLTRVTEYVEEIIKFIEKIIEQGYAYASNGSVYFDIKAFQAKFKYGKLKRIKQCQTEEEETNEGNEKKNKEDFALWKAAKPDQPKWVSKWGQGRPGWHIQCSAMASAIFGDTMDIHSGGIDLNFPHHQNEMAQSQAHFNKENWVRFFIHIGHLHIKGRKMSKSLKNFITINNILSLVSPRIIRLYFVLHQYDVVLNYDPQTSLSEAVEKDRRYHHFFSNLQAEIRTQKLSKAMKMDEQDNNFDQTLQQTSRAIYQAFCNNINTPQVICEVDDAMKRTNIYLANKNAKKILLEKAFKIILQPLKVIGLEYEVEGKDRVNEENLINTIVKFRDQIRENSKSQFRKILQICDKFRDYQMVEMGIRLEDKNIGEAAVWKFQSKEILMKERQAIIANTVEKERKKMQAEKNKEEKKKIPPTEMFRNDVKFSEFDERGIPTHERKKEKDNQISKPISEAYRKRLEKDWNAQNEIHNNWLNSIK